MVAKITVDAPPMRVEICANGINDIRFEADRIATSPVPPRPLWQQVTIADSIGYIFIRLPMKKPAMVIDTTTETQTST